MNYTHKEKAYKFFSKLFFANPIYSLVLLGKTHQELKIIPPYPWPGDPQIGERIIKSDLPLFLKCCSKKITTNLEKKNDLKIYYEIHSFDWINDLHSIGSDKSRKITRQLILTWIKNNNSWKYFSWDSGLIGKRIVNLFGRFNFFCSSANKEFKSLFFSNLIKQIRHLNRIINFEATGPKRITAAKGLIYSGICLSKSESYLKKGMDCLEKELKTQILVDGGHLDRNPSVHMLVLKDLVDIRASMVTANLKTPKILQSTIDRMAPILSLLKHNDGKLPLFNSSKEEKRSIIEMILTRTNAPGGKIFSAKTFGFERMEAKKTSVILDVGNPSKKNASSSPHAGSLSFEMSHGKERIITNCGAIESNNRRWNLAQRSTAAHSTLCLEDTNSSAIRPNGSLGNRIAKVKIFRNSEKNFITISCQHDGYLEKFGIIHKRNLVLANNGESLVGKEILIFQKNSRKRKNILNIRIHFHLHPEVKALKLVNQRSILLTLASKSGWRFEIDNGKIQLEKSIYLGAGVRQKTDQIIVTQKIYSELQENPPLNWKITKLQSKSQR